MEYSKEKVFKKSIVWGFKTFTISQDRILLYEELVESWNKQDIELMKSNYDIVKREIQATLEDIKTLNESNTEYCYNIIYHKSQIAMYRLNSSDISNIIQHKLNVGKLKANKYINKMIKRKVKENLERIVENKQWLKILKYPKEMLRVQIYEAQLDLIA